MKTKPSNEVRIGNGQAVNTNFQTLDQFRRVYFPSDSQLHGTEVDSSEALLRELAQQSAVIIKAAFAENR
jgi:hypothetical protein